MKTIYYALVYSYLRYGLLAWGNASVSALLPLQTLNNRVLRIITFAPLGRLDTSIIFDHLKILTIENLFTLESGKFIYKTKNNILPISTIATHFGQNHCLSHRYFTRNRTVNSASVAPRRLMSCFAQKSIQLKANEIWTNIPTEIRNAESFNVFKHLLKKHLITH